jgi:peptide/nickel transport system substrate-binding protein
VTFLKKIFQAFNAREKRVFFGALFVIVFSAALSGGLTLVEKGHYVPVKGGQYHEGFVGQPIALNPVISGNPIDQEAAPLLYNPLGNLMSGYDVSSDGLTYNVKLHQDLAWSDGAPLTSDDVVYTVKTIQDPATNSPLAQDWRGVAVERVSQIQVRFTLTAPYAFFLGNVERLFVMPQHIYGNIPPQNFHLSDYNLEPVGSGPYRFQSFSKEKSGFITEYHLITNPYYYGPAPYIPDFYFDFYKNVPDLIQALGRHEIQGYGTLLPLGVDLKTLRGVIQDTMSLPNYYAVFFNGTASPALADPGVRRALVSAVNIPAILGQIPGATAISGPWLGAPAGGAASSSVYDPAGAATLIAAWKAKNKGAPLDLTLTVPNVDFLTKAADEIANDWKAAGVDDAQVTTFNPQDPTDATIESRNYEALLFGNVFENVNDLFPFWDSSQVSFPGSNLALYQNPKADMLIENARANASSTVQARYLAQAQSYILNDAPAAFLFSLPYNYYHTDELDGFTSGPLNKPADVFLNVNQWYVAKVRVLN